MITVQLKFSSLIYLSAFRKFAKAKNWSVDLDEMTVHCMCSEDMIQMAISEFSGVVLQSHFAAGTKSNKSENIFAQSSRIISSFQSEEVIERAVV